MEDYISDQVLEKRPQGQCEYEKCASLKQSIVQKKARQQGSKRFVAIQEFQGTNIIYSIPRSDNNKF